MSVIYDDSFKPQVKYVFGTQDHMDEQTVIPRVGNRVEITDKALVGTVAYVGQTLFQPGKWVGVVLDEAKGKNNGSVQGKQYFQCEENRGLFVRPAQVRIVDDEMTTSKSSDSSEKGPSSAVKPAPSGSCLKLPMPTKRPSIAGSLGSADSSSEQDVSSKMQSPPEDPVSSTKMKMPSRSGIPGSGMKQSTSTDKLKAAATTPVSAMKASPSQEKLTKAAETPVPKQSQMKIPQSSMKAPKPVTAAAPIGSFGLRDQAEEDTETSQNSSKIVSRRLSVAQQVAAIQQDIIHKGTEGILKDTQSLQHLSSVDSEYLKVEVTDLQEKLETLRTKRQEDKQKLIDYEKCKIQLHQLIEYKNKMQDMHSDLQRQLQQSRKEAKEAIEAREAHAEEMGGLAEAVEMATLDKEMAEEKADMLQHEVEMLKEKVEELSLDLEVLRAEVDQKGTSGVSEGLQLKQLEQQNERLKEAVVKLRDLSTNEKQEVQRLTKEIEILKSQVDEHSKKNEKFIVENKTLEEQVAELRDQVDAALGSEDLIEKLTDRNLALEEKVRQLEDTVEDLEQMRQMDEEMQESAKETERELLQELDLSRGRYNELRIKLDQACLQIKDHETTILKFRKHTAQLQDDIQDLKDKLAIQMAKKTASSSEEDGESGVQHQAFLQTRAQSDVVDAELRKLELELSQQHIRYLKAFLPDNFSKSAGDNDCLLITLLFPRLISKAEVLISHTKAKYPIPPSGLVRDHVVKSHKSEQWSFCARFCFYLRTLIPMLHKYESALSECSVERLARLAQLQTEMTAQERVLDQYLELLKTGRLDENTNLEALQKTITYFQNLYAVHLSSEEFDRAKFLVDSSRQALSGLYWLSTDITRILFYLLSGQETSTLWKFFEEIRLCINESEGFARRVRSHVPDDSKKESFHFPDEVVQRLCEVSVHIDKVAQVLHSACAAAGNQVTLLPDVEGIDSARMTELLTNSAEKIHGRLDKSANELIRLGLGVIMTNLNFVAQGLDNGEFSGAPRENKPFPPLLERAHSRRLEAIDLDDLRYQIGKKDTEIMDLKKALRLKAEEVSEMVVRKELAEKRLATTGKEGDDRVVKLQRKLEEQQQDMKKKEGELERTIDILQQDVDALEKENSDLKDRLKTLSKKALLQGISAGLASPTTAPLIGLHSSTGVPAQQSSALLQQIECLRSALAVAQQEKCRLQALHMKKVLGDLTPLKVPFKTAGLNAQTGLVDLDQASYKRHDNVTTLLRESNKLQKDFVDFVAKIRVVDISKRKPASLPTIDKQHPAYKLYQQQTQWKLLHDRIQDLNVKLRRHRIAAKVADVAQFARPASEMGLTVGRVSLPSSDRNLAGKTVTVALNGRELRELKARILP